MGYISSQCNGWWPNLGDQIGRWNRMELLHEQPNQPTTFIHTLLQQCNARPYKYEGNFLIFSEGFALTDRHSFLEYRIQRESCSAESAPKTDFKKTCFSRNFPSQGWVDMNTVYLSSFVPSIFFCCFFALFRYFRFSDSHGRTDERLKVIWAAIIFQLIWRRPRQTHTQSVLKTN